MPNAYRISSPQFSLSGSVVLESSKSISNRVLIIRSLCEEQFDIQRLSESDDTKSLLHMLSDESTLLNSGHAGSSYRFMAARACLGAKEIVLDGSAQLRKRQIGPLVKALRQLGAEIDYLNKEGFPPIRISPAKNFGETTNEIHLQSGISSQYVTSLLLVAPLLKNGLILHLVDDPVSVPYIGMTLELMKYFGVDHEWKNNTITVGHGKYLPREFKVEGDWSAASYYFSLTALAPKAEIAIKGVFQNSLQGDSRVADLYTALGVETQYIDEGIILKKIDGYHPPKEISIDFKEIPDLAQTVLVTLAGLGIKGNISGLKTLRIKETDRITAMQKELTKVKVSLEVIEEMDDIMGTLFGKAKWKDKAKFDTYGDHRMAMAFTPLACLNAITIKDPQVVSKSYPGFWNDMAQVGLKIEK